MKRSDPSIVSIQEFCSKQGDAGVAIGCVVTSSSEPAIKYVQAPGHNYTFHHFFHRGGLDPELERFWGHYRLDYTTAMAHLIDCFQKHVKMGYVPYKFVEDGYYADQAEILTDEIRAGEFEGLEEGGELDELVHEAAAASAATINNGGLEAQVEFLIRELGVNGALETIQRVIPIRTLKP